MKTASVTTTDTAGSLWAKTLVCRWAGSCLPPADGVASVGGPAEASPTLHFVSRVETAPFSQEVSEALHHAELPGSDANSR